MVPKNIPGRRINQGLRRMPRKVLVGGLLAILAPAAWGAGGIPKPPPPGGCIHSPTARCVIQLAFAAVEEIADADSRAELLARIAEAQANAGEVGEARNCPSRALAAAAGIDAAAYAGESWIKTSPETVALGEQARVFSLIARVQTDMGDTGGARETFSRAVAAADGIDDGHVRSAALVEVAKMQVAAGALPEARQTLSRANLADNVWNTLLDLPELVRAQAEAGDVAGALVTARTIPGDRYPGAWALAEVAAVQAAGDVSGALVTAEGIESAHYRMEAMQSIGIARARGGDVAGAWDAVRTIRDEIWLNSRLRDDTGARDVTLAVAGTIAAIAEAHIAKGEFKKALAAAGAEEMKDDFTFRQVRVAIVKGQIAAGHFDAARRGAEELCDTNYRHIDQCAEVLADLAAALAAGGSPDESREAASMALNAADRVVYNPDRTRAYIAAYTALMRVDDGAAAQRAFSSALAATEAIESADERAEEFIGMVEAAAREGDSDSAGRVSSRALAARDENGYQVLASMGLAGIRAGDAGIARANFSRAVAMVTAIETAYARARALADIAFVLASGRWPVADDYPGRFQ